ncbi:nuclear transport factor 2 family protein [Roseomonas rosulenta]|uniref:nuclear transport factor 2 family protein n=1 Tax=Roseomonas rosulenta TaxID=2748667 RepID=UPI0018DFB41B|nr:nuclear transport factor 2 family protein [Roseomonas rosulenta]
MPVDHGRVRDLAKAYTDAWNSGSPEAVAAFYAIDGRIVINRGEPWGGRARVADMAAGFYADVRDMKVFCDEVRIAGHHVAYIWTFTGLHAGTGNPLRVTGWEEWDLDQDLKVTVSRGWYDAEDYARQVAGGEQAG